MIQQYKDQYGRPVWPITHIDAVIDSSGRTLRQLLGDIPSAQSVQEEINKIIQNAPEAFDTLKEVADYIEVNGYSNIAQALNAISSSIPTKISQLNNDSGYLTQHQTLKTINNISLTGSGNISISGDGTGDVVAGNTIKTITIED